MEDRNQAMLDLILAVIESVRDEVSAVSERLDAQSLEIAELSKKLDAYLIQEAVKPSKGRDTESDVLLAKLLLNRIADRS